MIVLRFFFIHMLICVVWSSSIDCFADNQSSAAVKTTQHKHQVLSKKVFEHVNELLKNLKSSRYTHKTAVNEKQGIYNVDCSGFVGYILKQAARDSLTSIPVDKGHKRARAKNFYAAFNEAPVDITKVKNGWVKVQKLCNAQPGDIIAWRKEPMPPKGNTGHVVIVYEKPVQGKNGTVRVRIIDSSKSRHADDTRKKKQSGLGIGTMWFKVNAKGEPTMYHWSSPKRKPVKCPIAIGRAVTK